MFLDHFKGYLENKIYIYIYIYKYDNIYMIKYNRLFYYYIGLYWPIKKGPPTPSPRVTRIPCLLKEPLFEPWRALCSRSGMVIGLFDRHWSLRQGWVSSTGIGLFDRHIYIYIYIYSGLPKEPLCVVCCGVLSEGPF